MTMTNDEAVRAVLNLAHTPLIPFVKPDDPLGQVMININERYDALSSGEKALVNIAEELAIGADDGSPSFLENLVAMDVGLRADVLDIIIQRYVQRLG
jgi:hypothetical protein